MPNPDRSLNPFWKEDALAPGMVAVRDMINRQADRVRLHLKTHKQGRMLYYVNGRFWIRCYTHKRLEPATWLV